MKRIFLILLLSFSLLNVKAQGFIDWVQSDETPTITLSYFGFFNFLNYYCTGSMNGSIVYSGSITERGFVVNTSGNPTIADTKIVTGSGSGSFNNTISLLANTTYYCKAYALYSGGEVYSNQISHTTNSGQTIATNAASSVDCVGSGTVTLSGTITANGNTPNTNGIYWGFNTSTVNYQAVNSSTTSVSYTFDFDRGQTVYFKAGANDPCDGNVYGSVQSVYIPFIEPTALIESTEYNKTATSIDIHGLISEAGCTPLTSNGIVYLQGNSGTPTLSDNVVTTATGTGAFIAYVTGLEPATTYRARAFATNSNATDYSSDIFQFTTLDYQYWYLGNSVSTSCGSYAINSSATAFQACADLANVSCNSKSLVGTFYAAESLSVGQQLYTSSIPHTPVNITGYFFVSVTPSYEGYVIYVNNGIIQSSTNCP